jgi:hypothetical protein
MFNLVVTNVPGPQHPLYAAGARLLEIFPVVPLAEGQAVSIGLTSYDGGVYYGLNADWDAMPDVDVLAALIEESLAELVAASDALATHRESGSTEPPRAGSDGSTSGALAVPIAPDQLDAAGASADGPPQPKPASARSGSQQAGKKSPKSQRGRDVANRGRATRGSSGQAGSGASPGGRQRADNEPDGSL